LYFYLKSVNIRLVVINRQGDGMRITRDMTIAGVPAIQLRDTLRTYGTGGWDAKDLARDLKASLEDGRRIVEHLLAEGYLEVATSHRGEPLYDLTMKGTALTLASATKPIKRATAERLVEEVRLRAAAINGAETYLFNVGRILVFGSYLTDCPTLGDVDLAVELKPKIEDREALTAACRKYSADSGRRFSNFFQRLAWPEEEIYRILKNSNSYISLHPSSDAVLATADTRVIYEHS
jgi:hypothetical protein